MNYSITDHEEGNLHELCYVLLEAMVINLVV